jgi:N-acetylneuraminate synthase
MIETRTPPAVAIGARAVGHDEPVYVLGEIGINHNGDVGNALKLIDAAVLAGADAVKFQKRTPELCVPPEQQSIERDTPWGRMTYIDYRHHVELSRTDYARIDEHCRLRGIAWFASCWDEPSVDFMEEFDPVAYKVASASLTDHGLLKYTAARGRPVIASTGMSSEREIDEAVAVLTGLNTPLILCHSTSTYPCPLHELNLEMIPTLRRAYPDLPIGYSGHEVGLQTSVAAVALGACLVERHITLDRTMWGTDQSASVEPMGLLRLVRDIRAVEAAAGDGVKRVYDSELPIRAKLRRNPT